MTIIKEFKGIFEVDKAFYECFKECVSKDETRIFINYVYYDGAENNFVATDGRRLIIHTPREFYGSKFTGFYELAKTGKSYKLLPVEDKGTFPMYQRIINDTDQVRMNKFTYKKFISYNRTETVDTLSISGNLDKDSYFISKLIAKIGRPLNINFLTKVLKHVPDVTTYYDSDTDRPVLFILEPQTKYIVQPMAD